MCAWSLICIHFYTHGRIAKFSWDGLLGWALIRMRRLHKQLILCVRFWSLSWVRDTEVQGGLGVTKCWLSFILKRQNKKGQFMRCYKEERKLCTHTIEWKDQSKFNNLRLRKPAPVFPVYLQPSETFVVSCVQWVGTLVFIKFLFSQTLSCY